MAVRLRLRKTGRKNQPSYKVVAADSRSPRDGRFLETVGTYNPLRNPAEIKINEEKAFKWLKRGALPTDTVRSLLRKSGLWYKWYLMKKGLDESAVAQKLAEWQAGQEAKNLRGAERKQRRKASKKAKKATESAPAAEASAQLGPTTGQPA
ncbi:MAG: 30S ribosomal protein S16 [Ignavibacteriae bacterium 37-53-5]|nr:MAG: 30S ribosomal protein S16 [Ignavibacteriae bacterium 37-53-5]